MKQEQWKFIAWYEGLYEVSDRGRVRRDSRVLTPKFQSSGHVGAQLSLHGVIRRHLMHRLVLEAFVGPCPPGMETRHLDGDPGNNCVENLKWGTRKENMADRAAHGITNQGERHGMSKLTDAQVRDDVVPALAAGEYQRVIAARLGVAEGAIGCIARGFTWRHVTGFVLGEGPNSKPGKRTHCRRGHPYSGSNLHIDPGGGRNCRECRRASDRIRDRKARGAPLAPLETLFPPISK